MTAVWNADSCITLCYICAPISWSTTVHGLKHDQQKALSDRFTLDSETIATVLNPSNEVVHYVSRDCS